MSQYLRDEIIKNINIDEDRLELLNQYFLDTSLKANEKLDIATAKEDKLLIASYIIRFDSKGYRFFDFREIMKFYKQANDVERIIITLESIESHSSNRNVGSYLELKLDAKDSKNCYLVASGDDENWVSSVFNGAQELLKKFQNKSRYLHNYWTYFLFQLFGVMLGFILSLWAAVKISPYLSIENAFIICFLFILVIFSNLWMVLNRLIFKLLNYSFPNLRFKRKGKETMHWLVQSLIAGLVVALTIFLLNKFFEFIGSIVGSFIK